MDNDEFDHRVDEATHAAVRAFDGSAIGTLPDSERWNLFVEVNDMLTEIMRRYLGHAE